MPATSVHPEASIPRSFMRFLSCVTESSLRFSSSSISTILSHAADDSWMLSTCLGCYERTSPIFRTRGGARQLQQN